MSVEKVFKIMGERYGTQLNPIPVRVILPHERQALKNHSQTLLRLHQRGGLTPTEALCVLNDQPLYGDYYTTLRNMTIEEVDKMLRATVRARYIQIVQEEERQSDKPCSHPDRPKDISQGVRRCGKCGGFVAVEV